MTTAALGNIRGAAVVSVTLTPSPVSGNTTIEQQFTVYGMHSFHFVLVNPPSITAGIGIAGVRGVDKNVIAITFQNSTSGSLTPPAGIYKVLTMLPENVSATFSF